MVLNAVYVSGNKVCDFGKNCQPCCQASVERQAAERDWAVQEYRDNEKLWRKQIDKPHNNAECVAKNGNNRQAFHRQLPSL